jgi:hypothetical protein
LNRERLGLDDDALRVDLRAVPTSRRLVREVPPSELVVLVVAETCASSPMAWKADVPDESLTLGFSGLYPNAQPAVGRSERRTPDARSSFRLREGGRPERWAAVLN